jgi:anti-anti-sigma factor
VTTHHTIALGGELGIVDAAALREQLRQALALGPGDLALDLSDVQACDSAGVQLLLSLRRSLAERGDALQLLNPAEPVRHALATLGLLDLLAAGALE